MESERINGSVALVTGGAHGIGAAIGRRLAGLGAKVVLADVDAAAGPVVAHEIGGLFVRCDVGRLADNEAAVAAAVDAYGGLDIVALNAGVATGFGIGDDFDPDGYRRAMAINLDGVVYGAHAALPALRARGGGDIIATASLAGFAAMPADPVYGANKAGVIALVRALGPAWADEGVRVNGICPGYADTAIVDDFRDMLTEAGVPLLEVSVVVDAFMAALTGGRTGECWYIQPGRPSEPFRFPRVPGIRAGEPAQKG
ncbi:MAG: dehydrogenase [Actinobacteria bacterium 13_2_20CM_2_71_6]|nr:MAG: dehydrogenase [Actinobacteria bacterium 13_2_20CM_2_71_6]